MSTSLFDSLFNVREEAKLQTGTENGSKRLLSDVFVSTVCRRQSELRVPKRNHKMRHHARQRAIGA